ncbi:hypothetical protein ACWCPJ_37235 [Streptomyces collinus]
MRAAGVLSWDALDERSWPGVSAVEPADIARVLGVYAALSVR